MGKFKHKNCNVTWEKKRGVAAALANVTAPLTTTTKSACCDRSFQNAPGWSQYTGSGLLKSERKEQQKEEHRTAEEANASGCATAEYYTEGLP